MTAMTATAFEEATATGVATTPAVLAVAAAPVAPPVDCDGIMVLHRDGIRECLEPECVDEELPHGPIDIPCGDLFEEDCPRCGPLT